MIAPGRARRPGAARGLISDATEDELEQCPFCEGREDRTPPETLALPERRPPDSPGWTVRVVPNLYPALERQEVVVHSPRHVRSFAELTEREVELVAEAWRLRAAAARDEGFPYVHALVNEGRDAGASLAHSHSQLAWLREPPPAVVGEQRRGCGLCSLLEQPVPIDEADGVVATVHPAGRAPYEMLIAPRAHDRDWREDARLGAGLRVLASAVRRLRAVEGPVPWNAWLHGGEHWHLEVLPRLTVFAGIELGAEIYVNTVAPEEAARALAAARTSRRRPG